ncbi:MAG: hypothetical protein P4L28_02000 [Paludibacteraceae bacterium]|nr:hypothetical protein [Paludibacteraceae bacterium]
MNNPIDLLPIIEKGWYEYNPKRRIRKIEDLSVNVSTNKVFRITFTDKTFVFAKVSNFGQYENFKEDHEIINVLANNLERPYDHFLSSSLMKDNNLYLYRHEDEFIDVWMVFYRAVRVNTSLPKRLSDEQVKIIGRELAKFHKLCDEMTPVLPKSSKTLVKDIYHLLRRLEKPESKLKFVGFNELIKEHCHIFLENAEKYGYSACTKIPVFVDWNIGNFSVRENGTFFSRWDYDWFRMSSRMLDFYSFSRVCSDIGDKTDFSYTFSQLNEPRFLEFLKEYHKVFPLTRDEVCFMKEAYRFFILNYVISNGRFFFNEAYARKLQREAYEKHLPNLDKGFDAELILEALGL